MSAPTVYTYWDAIDQLNDFCHGLAFSATQPMLRRAIQTAYQELVAVRDWLWLFKDGRIQLEAPYTTGTLTYDHSGGTYERELTLADGVWPAGIKDWSVRIDNYGVSDVEDRKSDTVITLDVQRNPGQDIAAGATYTAYRRWYPMPNDFAALWAPLEKSTWLRGKYRPLPDLAALDKWDGGTGDVYYYAIGHGEGLYGSHVLYVSYASDTAEPLCIPYKRIPRTLRYSGHHADEYAGTITVTDGSATGTLSGTSLASGMIGSIMRIGTGSDIPTGLEGLYPYGEQRTIIDTAGGSTGTVTFDSAVGTSYSGVRFRVTDPVDLPVSAYAAFMRGAEVQIANAARISVKPATMQAINAAYQDALHHAKVADNPILERRWAGMRRDEVVMASDVEVGSEVE